MVNFLNPFQFIYNNNSKSNNNNNLSYDININQTLAHVTKKDAATNDQTMRKLKNKTWEAVDTW